MLEVGEEDLGAGDFDPHGMAPVGVLGSLRDLGGRLPPTYVIGCRPADIGEGIGLSEPVEQAVPVAMETVHAVLRERVLDMAAAETERADMCLGIPGQVVEVLEGNAGLLALVDVVGAQRPINLGMLEDPAVEPGQWVLIHMGFALERDRRGSGPRSPVRGSS